MVKECYGNSTCSNNAIYFRMNIIYLGWSDGISLGLGIVLLLKVLGSIIFNVNLDGLVYLLKKKMNRIINLLQTSNYLKHFKM